MITIENTEVLGWEAAVRGMRNPKNSWNQIDSDFTADLPVLGERDLHLAQILSDAGTDHGKYLRMIVVYVDLCAPLYWWKEFDTYKVGTTANSCSTMHKIQAKAFSRGDFSCEHLNADSLAVLDQTIDILNRYRESYNENPDKHIWWQMIQLLPSSYNQRRTILFNYQVLKNMYHARKMHKLDEWRAFCKWIETLPYSDLITAN